MRKSRRTFAAGFGPLLVIVAGRFVSPFGAEDGLPSVTARSVSFGPKAGLTTFTVVLWLVLERSVSRSVVKSGKSTVIGPALCRALRPITRGMGAFGVNGPKRHWMAE